MRAPGETWPSGTVALMGAAGAVKILCRREIEKANDPKAFELEKTAEHEETFDNPYKAAARGFIDEVIEAHRTRPMLIRALELLKTKYEERPMWKRVNSPL